MITKEMVPGINVALFEEMLLSRRIEKTTTCLNDWFDLIIDQVLNKPSVVNHPYYGTIRPAIVELAKHQLNKSHFRYNLGIEDSSPYAFFVTIVGCTVANISVRHKQSLADSSPSKI